MNIRMSNGLVKAIAMFFTLSIFSANSFAGSVSVMHPYVRAVPEGQANSAAFMMLKNNSKQDRALVAAHSTISKTVELHTHRMEDGMMRMRQVPRIDIKAGSETVLKPGGLHVMFIGLHHQLKPGDKVDLELVFDDGESIKLSAPVKMVAGMKHMKQQH